MAKKSNLINLILLCVVSPLVLPIGYYLFGSQQFYIPAAIIVIASMVPFFLSFEKKETSVRELAVTAALIAVCVAGRTVFYAYPQIKPVAAIVIIAGAAFGYEVGFFVGSMSMLLSNIVFGQGTWTPFQMLAMGMVGFVGALVLNAKKIRNNRLLIAIAGGMITFFVYGLIVDMHSVFMFVREFNIKSIVTVYSSGVVTNSIFAIVTALCIFIFGKSFTEKLARLKTKYGIFKRNNE